MGTGFTVVLEAEDGVGTTGGRETVEIEIQGNVLVYQAVPEGQCPESITVLDQDVDGS